MEDRKLLGKLGEDMASAMLYGMGYQMLARNFRSHYGEIDIICEKDGIIYFVEVKTRTCSTFGEPEESVNEVKQHRMKKTAEFFLMSRRREINVFLRNERDKKGERKPEEPGIMFKVIEIMLRETDDPLMSVR